MDGQDLTPELMLRGYASGVFPMAESADDPTIMWVDPHFRGVLPLDGFRLSRSLARRIRRGGFEIALNRDFTGCIDACADRDETWINPDIARNYVELQSAGHAHSFEVWADGALIGGVLGITLNRAFFGESMFSRRTDASKIALAFLMRRLRDTGFVLFDTQFITPHLASLGAEEIPRALYRERLARALTGVADLADPSRPLPSVQEVLEQRRTHRS